MPIAENAVDHGRRALSAESFILKCQYLDAKIWFINQKASIC